ncbi:hypothetical protein AWZ03_013619 [Drosophila navojoa]|uniref:Uncharacterized protein n=1 Tax=Drosophila navojoa TaxID=7232 RepID=A0A484AWG1_DRONA|nr:hypothetical protein AWZ03_013619 [Drosophila navojoa]
MNTSSLLEKANHKPGQTSSPMIQANFPAIFCSFCCWCSTSVVSIALISHTVLEQPLRTEGSRVDWDWDWDWDWAWGRSHGRQSLAFQSDGWLCWLGRLQQVKYMAHNMANACNRNLLDVGLLIMPAAYSKALSVKSLEPSD